MSLVPLTNRMCNFAKICATKTGAQLSFFFTLQLLSQAHAEDSPNNSSSHFPHQYSIQIRWKKPIASMPKYRTKNNERSRYRSYAHQEEEHWHDKAWTDARVPHSLANDQGTSAMDQPSDEPYRVTGSKFATLPVYARPLANDASVVKIRRHFAVPSPSFPVNKRFRKWSHAPVKLRWTCFKNSVFSTM